MRIRASKSVLNYIVEQYSIVTIFDCINKIVTIWSIVTFLATLLNRRPEFDCKGAIPSSIEIWKRPTGPDLFDLRCRKEFGPDWRVAVRPIGWAKKFPDFRNKIWKIHAIFLKIFLIL